MTRLLRLKQLPPSWTRAVAVPSGTGSGNGWSLHPPASETRNGFCPSTASIRTSAIVAAARDQALATSIALAFDASRLASLSYSILAAAIAPTTATSSSTVSSAAPRSFARLPRIARPRPHDIARTDGEQFAEDRSVASRDHHLDRIGKRRGGRPRPTVAPRAGEPIAERDACNIGQHRHRRDRRGTVEHRVGDALDRAIVGELVFDLLQARTRRGTKIVPPAAHQP